MTHQEKMQMKAERREQLYAAAQARPLPHNFTPAWMNRRTRLPHENAREIARRRG